MDDPAFVDFDNCVDFSCADINGPVMVRLRVYEASSNPSFNENEAFGLLFNECTVEVTVEDKTDPIIICPPDKVLDCDADTPINEVSDNPADGSPTFFEGELIGYYAGAIDNCENNEVIITDNANINDCGEGTIFRTWTIVGTSGATASCTQRILLQKTEDRAFLDGNVVISGTRFIALQGEDDEIRFPNDRDLSLSLIHI